VTWVPDSLAKIGLRDRAEVVVFACESGLVEAGEHDIGRRRRRDRAARVEAG